MSPHVDFKLLRETEDEPDPIVPATCWCERSLVYVRASVIRAGETGSCGTTCSLENRKPRPDKVYLRRKAATG